MTSTRRRPSLPESTNGSSSSTLLQKAKRTLSVHRPRAASFSLKGILSSSTTTSASSSTPVSGTNTPSTKGDHSNTSQKPYSIAPTSHRENTALHALLDSLPTLPTFHAPSLPNVSLPSFSFNSLGPFSSSTTSTSRALTDDEAEDSTDPNPTPTPTDKDWSSDPLKRLSGPVVTLGGYRGSILRDAVTNKRIWIPMKVGFRMRKVDLTLGLEDEDELRSTETIVPGRQLMQVGPIDLGKRLKDKLKSLSLSSSPLSHPSFSPAVLGYKPSPLNYINHGYDWRRRLELSSLELLTRLEKLKKESAERGEGKDGKGEGATVVAHSMGGLVTLHALARASDPTVFKGIIFAGTPFGGCVNVLSPLRNGDGVLFNREICAPSVVFSMRSSYYFLPFSGLCFEDPSGTPLPIDFFDPHSWSDYGLSPVALGLFEGGEKGMRERREGREEAEKATEALGGGGGLGEGNLGEGGGVGVGVQLGGGRAEEGGKTRGIEEALRGVELVDGAVGEGKEMPRRGSIPLGEAEGEVEIDGLVVAAREEEALDTSDADADAEPTSTSAARVDPLDSNFNPSTRRPTNSSSEEEDEAAASSKPSFPSLDKVLSASDQTLALYLTKTLTRVKQFHADLVDLYDPLKAEQGLYPPLVLLTSKKTPTVRGVIARSRESIKEDPYEELLWDEGDGIVLHSSASILPGGPSRWTKHLKGEVESNYGHVSLVGDVDSIRKCLVKLYDE
ncbi:hypothetical protein BCR35DRAFT_324595 [Leucosporidium creatinivorum]|uniref:Lecithin:cholesterol acyltransferase-domain-containing protein n=1 Tax=Leucosporidium creatinivorum TaxID=106004 RepID=A0A1Y2FPN0_9BASI|nr:hypothetical protein BCR35DRAFT_324595 [Leucosporidium creatinivorum]